MAETTYEKRGLIDGIGNLFLRWNEEEGTSTNPPKYGEEVFETPSIDQVEVSLTVNNKDIFLSNKIHNSVETIAKAEINLQAGYLPAGFAEKAQGMVEVGEGAWAMPNNPQKKAFSMAFPITDSNDDEIVMIFPYCTLGVADVSAQTRNEERQEQIPSFTISSTPILYRGSSEEKSSVYYRIDLTTDEAKKAWDRIALLTTPIFDKSSLEKAKGSGSSNSGTEASTGSETNI